MPLDAASQKRVKAGPAAPWTGGYVREAGGDFPLGLAGSGDIPALPPSLILREGPPEINLKGAAPQTSQEDILRAQDHPAASQKISAPLESKPLTQGSVRIASPLDQARATARALGEPEETQDPIEGLKPLAGIFDGRQTARNTKEAVNAPSFLGRVASVLRPILRIVRKTPRDPAERVRALVDAGRLAEAWREIQRIQRENFAYYDENIGALHEQWLRIQKLRYAFYHGEDPQEAAYAAAARKAENKGALIGFTNRVSAPRQCAGGCATWSLDQAILASVGYQDGRESRLPQLLAAANALTRSRNTMARYGLEVAELEKLAGGMGIGFIPISDIPVEPDRLVSWLASGEPILGYFRFGEPKGSVHEETKHEVFIRNAFKRRGKWIFGVHDPDSGGIRYMTWERLSGLLEELHFLDVRNPESLPQSLLPR